MSCSNVNDYAKLHFSYHEDTDLAMIADALHDEHGMGWLVWLYWPRIIAKAKQAQTFGWFSTTPRALAASVHDDLATAGLWSARARMWELFVSNDLLRVRDGISIDTPTTRVDLLLVEYEKWQALSNKEHSKLRREREKAREGKPVDWVVRHWSDFAFTPVDDTDSLSPRHGFPVASTVDPCHRHRSSVDDTDSGASERTLDETRRDEREGSRCRDLPPTVRETIDLVRDIPGLSRWQLESHVRKAMAQYPSLPDDAVCEAITAFESRLPEGKAIHTAKAWQSIRNCFDVARKRVEAHAATTSGSHQAVAPVALLEEFRALRAEGGVPS